MTRVFRFMLPMLLLSVCLSSTPVGAAGQNAGLQQAAENGNLEEVHALIDKRAEVNARDGTGRTALMVAAARNQVEILKVLLQKGADVNEKTTGAAPAWMNGWTALMYAANHGSCNAVRILLNAGANAKAMTDDG